MVMSALKKMGRVANTNVLIDDCQQVVRRTVTIVILSLK